MHYCSNAKAISDFKVTAPDLLHFTPAKACVCVVSSPLLVVVFPDAIQSSLWEKSIKAQVPDEASIAPLTLVTCQPSSCLPSWYNSEGSPSSSP